MLYLGLSHLCHIKIVIDAFSCHEFLMISGLGYAAVLDNEDTVRISDANQLLYIGNNQVVVGASFTYNATILYKITKDSEKNTLTVVVPEYELPATAIGDLVIGKYTIEDIPYDETHDAYYKEYADGTLSMHFKASSGIDNDYVFINNTINTSIEIKFNGLTADILNNYSIGNMPMPICTTFSGKQQ